MSLLIFLCLLGLPQPEDSQAALEHLGCLSHPEIREASGLVRSRRHAGVFWTHNDSGNPPTLFAVGRDGTLLRRYSVAVPNVDWEDIATDGQGHLYLGDIGNNGGILPVRVIYQFDEPDPSTQPGAPLKPRAMIFYTFPAGRRFDAEGLVIDGDRALIVAKTFDGRPAEIFELPLNPPAPFLRPAIPLRVAELESFKHPVTGASLTADGQRLAVCSLGAVGIYSRGTGRGWRLLQYRTFSSKDQIEAVAWDGDDLLLAGERRGVYRLSAAHLAAPTPTVNPASRR
jgi:hypothetical protein